MSSQLTFPSAPQPGGPSKPARSVREVISALAAEAATMLGAEGAAVWLADGEGCIELVTATDESIAKLERLQISLVEGPSRDASVSAAAVRSDDLGADDRWPRFRVAALREGFQGIVSVPAVSEGGVRGGLSLYATASRPWRQDQLALVARLAGIAVDHSMMAGALEASQVLAGQLRLALESRILIEQAKGITSHCLGVSINEAFELLRGHARRTSTKVQQISSRVVEGELDPHELEAASGTAGGHPSTDLEERDHIRGI